MDPNGEFLKKRCFKSDIKVLGNLNIANNASNSITILWNKYQILVFEELAFNGATRIIEPEFEIFNLLLYNNHIACLDCSGDVHIISLKFKNPAKKRYKCLCHPVKQNVLAFALYTTDDILTLRRFNNSLFVSFHQIDKEFQLEKELQLLFGSAQTPVCKRENCILKSHTISESNLKSIEQLFNVQNGTNNLVVISFDKLVVYASLIGSTMLEDKIKMVKIYSCPSEVSNIQIFNGEDLKVVIGLCIGTLIVIPLNNTERKPTIVHLNTSIHKFLISDNTSIHTDGCTIWKTQNIFSKDVTCNKLFVKQVNDFVIVNDTIICTTFANLIYVFSNNESSYIKSQNKEKYSPAGNLINNTDCLNKIMLEIKKNNELVKKLKKEENYITALSLSNRQDVMNDIISTKIIVYENYEDAIKEYIPIILTEEVQEYFKPESMFFLVNICVNTSHNVFNNILSNLFTDLKVHISFSSEKKLLKTTSIKFGEHLKNVSYLIPLKVALTRVNVNIMFVTNIPGTYDTKQTAWTVLYRKHITLNSENFIVTNNTADRVLHLNTTEKTQELILKTTQSVYESLFSFTDISKSSLKENDWSLYVKLPADYPEALKNSDYCEKYLNFKTSAFLSQQYTAEDFLKGKNNFVVMVGEHKVIVELVNDGFSNPVLKICSGNLKIALDIRNFFANILYKEFDNYLPDEEFISHTFYTTVEHIQKAVKNFITKVRDIEEFTVLAERFERNVIGALPI